MSHATGFVYSQIKWLFSATKKIHAVWALLRIKDG